MKKRRVIRLVALLAAVLVLSIVGLVQTPPVRRAVLARVSASTEKSLGFTVQAGRLDYNLLTARVAAEEVSLRHAAARDLSPFLSADRVSIRLRYSSLLRGSFAAADLRVEGLRLQGIVRKDGSGNLPPKLFESTGSQDLRLPIDSVEVSGLSLAYDDERAGLSVRIPAASLHISTPQPGGDQDVHCELLRGSSVRRDGKDVPVDQLTLDALVQSSQVLIRTFQLTSAASTIQAQGSYRSGTASRLELSAEGNLDSTALSPWIGLTEPLTGRIKAKVQVSGAPSRLSVEGKLNSDLLRLGALQWDSISTWARLSPGAEALEWKDLQAGMYAGQLASSGRLALSGQGESSLSAELNQLDLRKLPTGKSSSRLPAGKASVRIAAACRGLEWSSAQMKASAAVQLNRGLRTTGSSTITGDFDSRLRDRRLFVNVGSIEGHGAKLKGSVVIGTRDQSLAGELTGSVRSLSEFLHALESDLGRPAGSLLPLPVDGALESRVSLSGSIRDPGAVVDLTATGLSAGDLKDAELHVLGSYAGGNFHIDQARLDWRNQTATASGDFGLGSDAAPLRLDASAENTSVAEILRGLGIDAEVQAMADARVSVTGNVGDPRMSVHVKAGDVNAYGEGLGNLDAEASWQGGTLEVSRLRLEKLDTAGTGTLDGWGTYNSDSRTYEFSLTGRDLRPTSLRLPGDTLVRGTLQLKAHGTGSLDNPGIHAEAECTDLQLADYSLGVARAVADISNHRARLKVEAPTVGAVASGDVVLDGEYPFQFEISAPELAQSITKAGEAVATVTTAAAIRGEGRLSPPELLQASALFKDLQLARGEAKLRGEGPVDIGYASGRLTLKPVVLALGESRLEVSGSLPLEGAGEPGEIALAGKIDLASIHPIISASGDFEAAGTAALEGRLRGNLRDLRASATLKLEGGRVRSKALPGTLEDLKVDVSMHDDRIHLERAAGKVGGGTISASGDLPIEFLTRTAPASSSASGDPARFSLEMTKIPISAVFRVPDLTTGEFSLAIAGEAARPAAEAVDARLELSEFSLRREAASVQLSEPSIFRISGGELRVERSNWKGLHGEMQLAGTVGLAGDYPLDLILTGEGDASFFSLFSTALRSSGSLRLDLRARGPLRDPQVAGTVDLEKGSIGFRQPRLVAEEVEFSAAIDGRSIDIRKLSGILNGGRLQGGGSVSLKQGKLEAVQIDLRGQDVFLEYPAGMKTALDLDLKVRSRDSTIVLGGEMNIREGSYLDPFDFSQAKAGGADLTGKGESSGKMELLGSKFVYDVAVRSRQPIVIDNNLARLSAKVDVRLVGEVGRPGMRGEVTLDRGGKVYFGGRTYSTERGVVTFASDTRLDPVFNVVATTRVNDYQVTLRLAGTGTEITSTFTSDPPLSQNDVVALLLTGKPASESGGSRTDPAQAEKLSLLAGALNADLSGRMRRRFGVSQVMIQPGAVSEESDPGARLTVGQNLSDSLQLVYSMNLVNSGDQLWYLEYDLQRRFTARAVMQSDNTYRTDFQQDIRFGGQREGSDTQSSSGSLKLKVGKVEFSGNTVFPASQLAKEFKLGPGSKFTFARSHKGVDRLTKFYAKRDYLEARIQMDRTDEDGLVNLTAQVEAGQPVKFAYTGTGASGSVRKLVRKVWQEGISDRQRLSEVEDRLHQHFAKQGYLQARTAGKIRTEAGEKRVEVDLQPGTRFRKVETVFEGATPEDAEAMAARIQQRKLDDQIYLDSGKVTQDLTAYYRQHGHYLAKIEAPRFDLDQGRATARIVFPVTEGPEIKVGTVGFTGNKRVASSELAEKLPLAEGAILGPDLVQRSVAAITDRYGRAGFRSPGIEPTLKLDEKQASVDVTFSIQEGVRTYVRSLEVSGQERISEKFVREQLRIGENAPQDFPQTSQSIRNLYNTGAFTNVSIEPTPDKGSPAAESDTETVDLAVKVHEVSPYKVRYGGYFDSGRGPGVIFDIENRNSLGNARVLGLRTRYDKDLQEARLYLTQPLWKQKPRPTTGTLYFRRENDYYEGLSAQRVGFTVQQEALLSRKLILSYGLRIEDVYTWYPDQRADNPPREIVSPLTLSLTRNTRDDFLDPTRGSFISTAVEYAPGIVGDHTEYTRFFGQYSKYFPLFKPGFAPFQGETKRPRTIFATGIRVGLLRSGSSQPVIPTERFYAGGGTTVRGFKQDTLGPLDEYGDPLGGNAMLVLNNELRFPVVSVLDGVGFVDVGNVFPTVQDFKLSDLRKTAGLGLRLRLPGLMLRFDYGMKLDRRPGESRGAFFFSIGQAF